MSVAKKLSIRLEAVGGDKVRQEFKRLGSDGQQAFHRITQVIQPANDNLRVLANRYRRRIVTFTTELEGLVPSYGDMIAITHDMAKWGQGGEVVEKNGLTLSLSEPVSFAEGQTHYVALRQKNGSLSGPYVVTAGSLKTEVILSEEPSMDILTGTDAERTHFAFGAADKWSVFARVTGIKPRSGKDEITAAVEDSRVHAN